MNSETEIKHRLLDVCKVKGWDSDINIVGFHALCDELKALGAADEREAIYSEWHSCVMADLENGVKWLNEKAAAEWHKNYPAQSNLFPAWIEARGQV
jgi:hypothetical protein